MKAQGLLKNTRALLITSRPYAEPHLLLLLLLLLHITKLGGVHFSSSLSSTLFHDIIAINQPVACLPHKQLSTHLIELEISNPFTFHARHGNTFRALMAVPGEDAHCKPHDVSQGL
jgi:hypothetical protein